MWKDIKYSNLKILSYYTVYISSLATMGILFLQLLWIMKFVGQSTPDLQMQESCLEVQVWPPLQVRNPQLVKTTGPEFADTEVEAVF